MFRYLWSLLLFCYAVPSSATEVILPAGTQVYLEPNEIISSKRGDNREGEIVLGTVWRDVVADGWVVIEAGAPAVGKITEIKRRNVAGKKGQIKIAAISARGVQGDDIPLEGGYHETGKSRVALSVSLFLLVAWPLIFIPGKNAQIGPGNIFDGEVAEDTAVDVSNSRMVTANAADNESGLSADVMYDTIDPDKKLKYIPIEIVQCGKEISSPRIVTLNGAPIDPLKLSLKSAKTTHNCTTATAEVEAKPLLKQFSVGINRFEVESNGQRAEIIFQGEV